MLVPMPIMETRAAHDPRRPRRSRRATTGLPVGDEMTRANRRGSRLMGVSRKPSRGVASPTGATAVKPTLSEPQTFVNPEAALAAAYAEYNKTIQERWRK